MMKTLKCLVFVFAMLFRIASKYKVTESIFWTAIVSAMIGFRQDSPTSSFCLYFCEYIDQNYKREMTRGWFSRIDLSANIIVWYCDTR